MNMKSEVVKTSVSALEPNIYHVHSEFLIRKLAKNLVVASPTHVGI